MIKGQNGKKILKLADFGTSKFVTGATRRTVIGTPDYQSPQQAKGDCHQDSKCDVYSFGAIFFKLLTGSPPKA
jgi:serine/threonine protein kinase